MTNVYRFSNLKVFFKHTDYYGYVHPYNYFEWTSYVREAFFTEKCPDFKAVLNSHIKMMTSKIQYDSLSESYFGDEFEAQFTVDKIKKVSFDVNIKFFNLTQKIYSGSTTHTLVFLDELSGRLTNIPESIRTAVSQYQEAVIES